MADPTGDKGGAGPPTQDIAAIAGYGPPPQSFLGAPSYALAVRKRQKELTAKISEINGRMKSVEAERDGAEAQLGQAAVDFGIVTGQEAEALKSKVAEAERSISGAKERKSQEDEFYEREMERLGREIEELEQTLGPLLERLKNFDREIKAAEAAQSRAEALAKRIEIELRNTEQAVAKGTADPAAAQERIAELSSHRNAAETEMRTKAAALGRTKAESSQLSAQVAPTRSKHAGLTREREDLVKEHEERVGAHSQHQKLASTWRRSRLAIIGRQVFDMDPRPKLLDAERLWGRIDQSRDKVLKVQEELELYLKAMDAYDPDSIAKSKYVVMAAGGVLAVLLLALLLYTC